MNAQPRLPVDVSFTPVAHDDDAIRDPDDGLWGYEAALPYMHEGLAGAWQDERARLTTRS